MVSLKILGRLPFNFFVGSYGQGRSRSTYADDYCSNTGSLSVKHGTTKRCTSGERNGHIFTYKLTQKKHASLRHGLTMSSDEISTNAQIGQLRDQSRPAKWIFHDRRTKGVIDVQNCKKNSKLHKNLASLNILYTVWSDLISSGVD